ncbi:PREDICTED: protein APCDD1-like, partial [Nicrophorus vespilloides]|uniref:Protein APCDD1-like n=1 Tax=Nicrophorus vespilloides TaxID=110193 RepID=A0ABM1ME34_NICVS
GRAFGDGSQCEVVAARVALENQNTVVDSSSRMLSGTWLSEGCENRPGPEYVLRSYTFKPDGSYRFIQHHYWDDSCSTPKLTIVSVGLLRMKKGSMFHGDSSVGFIRPINISIIPQDIRATKELDDLVAHECPDQNWKAWRRYDEHLVYENNNFFKQTHYQSREQYTGNSISGRQMSQSSGDISCLGSLKWAFNELKLIKIQLRPIFMNSLDKKKPRNYRFELLLGDIHSRTEHRENYSPTSYQQPLINHIPDGSIVNVNSKNYTIKNNCNICANLFSSSKTPPHLFEKPHLPPFIWGEWTSTRCEIRPMGLYLTRKFNFFISNSEWVADHKFYDDPFCTIPKFVASVSGHFSLSAKNTVIPASTNIDLILENASLIIHSRRMVREMNLLKTCGPYNWKLGQAQDLSSTRGCAQLGILVPSVHYDIVKVEINYEGNCLLYLGQFDTDNMPTTNADRPSAFQEPLVKCGEAPNFIGEEDEYYDDLMMYNSSIQTQNLIHILIMSIALIKLL